MTAPETAHGMVIVALGDPAPQGSKRYVGHRTHKSTGRRTPLLVEQSARVGTWRKTVTLYARRAFADARRTSPLEGPLVAEIVFSLTRPASVTRPFPHRRGSGDVDKLLRATLDALDKDARVIADDAAVCDVHMSKRYAGTPGALAVPGAVIRLTPLA